MCIDFYLLWKTATAKSINLRHQIIHKYKI